MATVVHWTLITHRLFHSYISPWKGLEVFSNWAQEQTHLTQCTASSSLNHCFLVLVILKVAQLAYCEIMMYEPFVLLKQEGEEPLHEHWTSLKSLRRWAVSSWAMMVLRIGCIAQIDQTEFWQMWFWKKSKNFATWLNLQLASWKNVWSFVHSTISVYFWLIVGLTYRIQQFWCFGWFIKWGEFDDLKVLMADFALWKKRGKCWPGSNAKWGSCYSPLNGVQWMPRLSNAVIFKASAAHQVREDLPNEWMFTFRHWPSQGAEAPARKFWPSFHQVLIP